MNKVHYWLLLKIAEMPKVFIYGIGLVIALALMLGAIVTAVWLDQSRIAQRHDTALRIFQSVTAEGVDLLNQLAGQDDLNCSDRGLVSLNVHLLGTRYLREIGLLDHERRLICSTSLGQLSAPIKGNYPVQVTRSGVEMLVNVPLTMAGKKQAATIIQRPRVNVVISPFATDDLYTSSDVVWLSTTDGLFVLHTRVDSKKIPRMKARAERLTSSRFLWRGLSYELVSMTPGLDVVLQTQRSLLNIARQDLLLLALFAGTLLIAVLTVGTITPYVLRLSGLVKRIGFLCDDAHLMLLYQPVFDLQTMRPMGCEVLARLKEKDKIWSPDQMIPAIVDAELERRFDHAVMRKAILELAVHFPRWEGGKFSIALNCFPKSIDANRLVPLLKNALQASERDDFEICIEVTEHSLSSELIGDVQQLKSQGFLIAVDDFGTGYSNLKSVTQLSPDLLKIDGSFVYELEGDTVRSNLIPEIVRIAIAVNAQTVAEGIEKMEQVELLRAEGVRYGQGYALGRPKDVAAFVVFITSFQ